MKRIYLIIGVLLIAVFLSVSLFKRDESVEQSAQTATQITGEERSRITSFWDLYRQATQDRIDGNYPEAGTLYVRALQLNPQHEDALYYGGNTFYTLGKIDTAENYWQRLIRINPRSTRAYIQLGDLNLTAKANLEKAEQYYKEAFRISQEETGPLLRLGQIALVKQNYQLANQYFEDVLRAYNNVEAAFLSGYIAWESDSPDRALVLLGNSVKYANQILQTEQFSSDGDVRTDTMARYGIDLILIEPFLEDLFRKDTFISRSTMDGLYNKLHEYLQSMRAELLSGV